MKRYYFYLLFIFSIAITGKVSAQDSMENAIDIGIWSNQFDLWDTQNTFNSGGYYQGPYSAVFYKFTICRAMRIAVSHRGSIIPDTFVYLLDESGQCLQYRELYPYTSNDEVQFEEIPAGIYYIVSQGAQGDGEITTDILGICRNIPHTVFNLGSKSSSFTYTDTKNTSGYNNYYTGRTTNDLCYMFALTTPMTVDISTCGSAVSQTCLYLLNGGEKRIAECDGYEIAGNCSNPRQATLKATDLPAGTYYIIAEGYNANGNITIDITGSVKNASRNLIDLGSKNSSFHYWDSQDTAEGGNFYNGYATNDVFYKFELVVPMNITVTHCDSHLQNTHMYLLDTNENLIAESNNSGNGGCPETGKAFIGNIILPAGTYYVVSEGETTDGIIATAIKAYSIQERRELINCGVKDAPFTVSYIDHTENGSNTFEGQPTNDVFYKITLAIPMNLIVSNAGSSFYTTIYLLDVDENIIAYNTRIGSDGRSYLEMKNLPVGTYYIVSEGYEENGELNTKITGTINRAIFDIGVKDEYFTYTDTRNTSLYVNSYIGQSTKDVFYQFTIPISMEITVSHCDSEVGATCVYLLDADLSVVASNSGPNEPSYCSNRYQAYLKQELPAGTYFVVSEGRYLDGNITTFIKGSKAKTVVDLGQITDSFEATYTQDTQDTGSYSGLLTNDAYYRFRITQKMGIEIFGSGLSTGTMVYLLDNSLNQIAKSDGTSGIWVQSLLPGIYYVLAEGKIENGIIHTKIKIAVNGLSGDFFQRNYVHLRTYTQEDKAACLDEIQYFDGLGRALQTVQRGITPQGKDLVTYQEYDGFGRSSNAWLPRVTAESSGAFVPFHSFKELSPGIYQNDVCAYSTPVYENSPLNRVLEQFGPGKAWRDAGSSVKTAYLTNNKDVDSLNCIRYKVTESANDTIVNISKVKNYDSDELLVNRIMNEDGNTLLEFKNKVNQVVLTRQILRDEAGRVFHDTYFIYNHYWPTKIKISRSLFLTRYYSIVYL